MRLRRRFRFMVATAVASALLAPAAPTSAAETPPLAADEPAQPARVTAPLLLTEGDSRGLHLFKGTPSPDGVQWQTLGTFGHESIETDRWVGQACATSSGSHAVVVYAPRQFTNRAPLFDRGAYVTVVDLRTGHRRDLATRSTLAYYSPGCGTDEKAVITLHKDGDGAERSQSKLVVLDVASATTVREIVLDGDVSNAVPVNGQIVASGLNALVRIEDDGGVVPLARLRSSPFRLRTTTDGAVAFMTKEADTSTVHVYDDGRAIALATGPAGRITLAPPLSATVTVLGEKTDVVPAVPTDQWPAGLRRLAASERSFVSADGASAVQLTGTPGVDDARGMTAVLADGLGGLDARINLPIAMTTSANSLDVTSTTSTSASGTTGPAGDPVDANRRCSVPRNDPGTQVQQPTWRQVEWAANLAIQDALKFERPANWKQSGLPAWQPQGPGMYPSMSLSGGGRVPAQILLGILAQESNLWQASGRAREGVPGNPLVGNFYGTVSGSSDPWVVNFNNADCGYGVGQVTDGMTAASTLRTANQKRAIALDYATNIAASLRILQSKWNETYNAGMRLNNARTDRLENWYYAVWAYNSGFYPKSATQPWGVGWFNNPINPRYEADRGMFNRNPDDARNPQRWPYPEKILGWAAYPIYKYTEPGYKQAYWLTEVDRTYAYPHPATFCDATNDCDPNGSYPNTADSQYPTGPCMRSDLKCWYHEPTTWKANCDSSCGFENLRFATTDPEPPDGTNYPPNCSVTGNGTARSGLPAGSLVIDDVPASTPSIRPCNKSWTQAGTFSLRFNSDSTGAYPSKIDFHQIGGGFGGHFWFSHARRDTTRGGKLGVTGTWTLDRPLNQWAQVFVHMPDHGAHTQQAEYSIRFGDSRPPQTRRLLQRTRAHQWVPLGTFLFAGVPSITLDTSTLRYGPQDEDGYENVAWDAVAIRPLAAKPRDFVVALGDSYSSGEGVSGPDGVHYYDETDNNGRDPAIRNACHRSTMAWPREIQLRSSLAPSIGARDDNNDPTLDFHMPACSGARTYNVITSEPDPGDADGVANTPSGAQVQTQYGEVTQIDRGFLDENTTLVTMSIGGNDARFADVVAHCIYGTFSVCQDSKLDDSDTAPMRVTAPQRIRGPVKEDIIYTLAQIRRKAPNAQIMLMGYPRLLERLGQCVPGIGTAEAPWLNEMSDVMAEAMRSATTDVSTATYSFYADPRSFFTGQAICGTPETIHGIKVDKTEGDEPLKDSPPSAESFHPKLDGAANYTRATILPLRQRGF